MLHRQLCSGIVVRCVNDAGAVKSNAACRRHSLNGERVRTTERTWTSEWIDVGLIVTDSSHDDFRLLSLMLAPVDGLQRDGIGWDGMTLQRLLTTDTISSRSAQPRVMRAIKSLGALRQTDTAIFRRHIAARWRLQAGHSSCRLGFKAPVFEHS